MVRPLNRAQPARHARPNSRYSCEHLGAAACLSADGPVLAGSIQRTCQKGGYERAISKEPATRNYIVTAPAITGPWSEPVRVNSSGFDPSLFHDEGGQKWFLNMVWNHRTDSIGGSPKHPAFAGILLQQYDPAAGRLIGNPETIFRGSSHGLVEGAHLFKRDGWYYLTVAEGGTGYGHAVTMARSRQFVPVPMILHPDTFLYGTAIGMRLACTVQRAGHGQMVETPDGRRLSHPICARRPLPGNPPLAARPRRPRDPENASGARMAGFAAGPRVVLCRLLEVEAPIRRAGESGRRRSCATLTVVLSCRRNSSGLRTPVPERESLQ